MRKTVPLPYSSCTPHYPIRSLRANCFMASRVARRLRCLRSTNSAHYEPCTARGRRRLIWRKVMNSMHLILAMLTESLDGCRISSNLAVRHGQHLPLRLHLPGQESPIVVERATVRWVGEKDFGLQFMSIPSSERERLGELLQWVA